MRVVLPLFLFAFTGEGKGCVPRQFESGVVCVCNSTNCDLIEPLGTIPNNKAILYRTDTNGSRMDRSEIDFSSTPSGSIATLDPSTVYQELLGFGGAFTDATGINIVSLSQQAADLLMRQYFGPDGAEYTLGRVPMASTDFSTWQYSYDDHRGDFELYKFKLAEEDFLYKIPFIKQAIVLQNSSGGLRLFSSPWSAPAWMKTNGEMKGGGELRGLTMGIYWRTWAKYFVRFFESYAEHGLHFWGTTIQNEPSTGVIANYTWQTMLQTPETERDFIKTLLGPSMKNSEAAKDVLIMTMDDQRTTIVEWSDIVFADAEASSFISGVALHWYLDNKAPIEALSIAHERHPEKFVLATEACTGANNDDRGVRLGNFTRGELYAYSIITDLNHFVTGWTDWNMALDLEGGPNWANNVVDAPIIVNAEKDEFFKQPMYYAMAHFSKFLKPGSRRVDVTLPEGLSDDVQILGAMDAVGRRVVVAMNKQNEQDITLSFNEKGRPDSYVNIDLPAHSIVTAIWNA